MRERDRSYSAALEYFSGNAITLRKHYCEEGKQRSGLGWRVKEETDGGNDKSKTFFVNIIST